MKLKAIRLLLLLSAMLLLLVACGGAAEPEVDIEATVQWMQNHKMIDGGARYEDLVFTR